MDSSSNQPITKEDLKDLATKQELKATEERLLRKIDETREDLRKEFKADMESLRKEFRADMDSLRKEFKTDMDSLRKEFKADMELFRMEMREQFVTKEEFNEFKNEVYTRFDQVLAILTRLDQERIFTHQAIRRLEESVEENRRRIERNEEEIKKIKAYLKID